MQIDGTHYRSIWPHADGERVEIIDQTRLPYEFGVVALSTMQDAAHAIRAMQVRGAPLIGATAAWGMALAMRADPSDANLRDALAVLQLIALPVLLLGESMRSGKVLATSGLERTVPWASSATAEESSLPQMNADMLRENLAYRAFLHDTLGQGEMPW